MYNNILQKSAHILENKGYSDYNFDVRTFYYVHRFDQISTVP